MKIPWPTVTDSLDAPSIPRNVNLLPVLRRVKIESELRAARRESNAADDCTVSRMMICRRAAIASRDVLNSLDVSRLPVGVLSTRKKG